MLKSRTRSEFPELLGDLFERAGQRREAWAAFVGSAPDDDLMGTIGMAAAVADCFDHELDEAITKRRRDPEFVPF